MTKPPLVGDSPRDAIDTLAQWGPINNPLEDWEKEVNEKTVDWEITRQEQISPEEWVDRMNTEYHEGAGNLDYFRENGIQVVFQLRINYLDENGESTHERRQVVYPQEIDLWEIDDM